MTGIEHFGWDRLRHDGLLLDTQRLNLISEYTPAPLPFYIEQKLRKQVDALYNGSADVGGFVSFTLEQVCGFAPETGTWKRGNQVGSEWTRRAVSGEAVKPRHLWQCDNGGILPVFFDTEKRVGIGRGRKAVSQVLQWLRAGKERLAVITNGRQWRLLFAGLDFAAWCEWDADLWFEEGAVSPQVIALRTLLSPSLWSPGTSDETPLLHQAIIDSRKGQAELSAVLGERVREAVEILIQAHGEVLKDCCAQAPPSEIYRAAVRVVMRIVVALFAESRDLLPRENALYHGAYGVNGLREALEKEAARGSRRMTRAWSAWPRLIGLFRLICRGSHHPDLLVPQYGGELFAPGDASSIEGLSRALNVFETACFDREIMCDRDVHHLLGRITRTRVKVRQGRGSTWVPAPVDFSDLSSEYIGILYEGLLDFELKTAPEGDPIVFLAVGNQPALPLSRLEAMDNKALANLLDKMKDTSRGDDEAEVQDEGAEDVDTADDAEDDFAEDESADDDTDVTENGQIEDARHTTRTRAEGWARKAVVVGKLVKKPRAKMTPEKRLIHEEKISRKARQLVSRVVLPGEWYLVRWGGTRKGAGTFYTRPGLAVPTVQRTLRPLAFDPPSGADGMPDTQASPEAWTPKKPEVILALKVCDPACGSGTFPVAALRYLTDALYVALHHHNRIHQEEDRSIIALITGDSSNEELLCREQLPSRPDDALFESRLRAILRRHVVERCIYGVDLDPLGVELCRLALWIETMDRELPFSFLDHKIKCGNSLIGAWFDQFQHYPVMAWKNREGGDKGHTNGVYYQKEIRVRLIKNFVKDELKPNLKKFLEGPTLFEEDAQEKIISKRSASLAVLLNLHQLPIRNSYDRARIYRDKFVDSEDYKSLKGAMDLWCACWFWPTDNICHAPLPTTFSELSIETQQIVEEVTAANRFFHWELEFPDVFRKFGSGFDAVIGNPPWETLQPNSKEFFSNIDPLYRSYAKQDALKSQTKYFADEDIESSWLDYNAGFANYANWVKFVSSPFGDPAEKEKSSDRFSILRGKANNELHTRWRLQRMKSSGLSDPEHPFRYMGHGKAYTYKMFLEHAYSTLREGGRLGFIVPSGLYSDDGTSNLRQLFLNNSKWEWCFNFENRQKIFEIDSRYKFNPIIVEKKGKTTILQFSANRKDINDWECAEKHSVQQTFSQIRKFSPNAGALVEAESKSDLSILEKIYDSCESLGNSKIENWGVSYQQCDFNLSSKSSMFISAKKWAKSGACQDSAGRWSLEGFGQAIPLYEGKMIWQHDFSFSSYNYSSSGWDETDWNSKKIGPRYLIPVKEYPGSPGIKLVFRDVSSPTNRRTLISTCIPDFPCSHKTPILRGPDSDWKHSLAISTVLNSYAFDYFVRLRFAPSGGGGSLIWSILAEQPLWKLERVPTCIPELLGHISLQLLGDWQIFSSVVASHYCTKNAIELYPAIYPIRRLELRCISEALNFFAYNLTLKDVKWILRDCDHPYEVINWLPFQRRLGSKLFWRVDKQSHPELRHTILSYIAYSDLLRKISEFEDVNDALIQFTSSKKYGWKIPETVILKDYGLGKDDRANKAMPVRSLLEKSSEINLHTETDWRLTSKMISEKIYGKGWTMPSISDYESVQRKNNNMDQMQLFSDLKIRK